MTSLNPAQRIADAHMGHLARERLSQGCRFISRNIDVTYSRFVKPTHGSPLVYSEKSFQAARISWGDKPFWVRTSVQCRIAVISPCIEGSEKPPSASRDGLGFPRERWVAVLTACHADFVGDHADKLVGRGVDDSSPERSLWAGMPVRIDRLSTSVSVRPGTSFNGRVGRSWQECRSKSTHLIGDSHPVQTPLSWHIIDREALLVFRVDLHLVRRHRLEQRGERQSQRQGQRGAHVGEGVVGGEVVKCVVGVVFGGTSAERAGSGLGYRSVEEEVAESFECNADAAAEC